MDIVRVTPSEYMDSVPDRRIFFNEPSFTELNRDKVEEIYYLLVKKGNSPRFGMILGVKDGVAKSPFSAPYAYPVVISTAHVEAFDEAVGALERYCIDNDIKEIRFTFPPFLYDEDILSVWTSAMYRAGYEPISIDINYILDLEALNREDYEMIIPKKGRSHLRKAKASGIEIVRCVEEKDIAEAYEVIVENHNAKGFPTHMSLKQLKDTFILVPHEVFLAKLDGKGIASMIYYETSKDIVECIYSGYLLKYSNSGVMNLLSWYAIRFFGDKGYKYIDRATAGKDSIPNYGLCDFKESIGGKRSLKYSFRKIIGGGYRSLRIVLSFKSESAISYQEVA
ncbi:MAG: hypothetical protein Q4C58_07885 [Eubacteriales bacterium]|nr:hypothetical protein [Eubacteriales bacterium]